MPKPGQTISPDAYPPLVDKAEAAGLTRILKSPETAVRASRVLSASVPSLRAAVHDHIGELEQAGADLTLVCDKAHEIRGLAETARLCATGRIADVLCRYFDESGQLGAAPDAAIVQLHVAAIGRAARAEDEASQVGDTVVRELSALVNRKLTEVKAS